MCGVLSSEDIRRIGASKLASQTKAEFGTALWLPADSIGVSIIGDNHPKSTDDLLERVVSYPPAAIGVTSAENGD